MGMDGVELVMEVEETFGLTIPDTEAQEIRTVGDLYALIVGKQRERDRPLERDGLCASASAFYALRRGAVAALAVDRAAVRPATSTATLLGPYLGRRVRWTQLETASGLRLPPLRWPVGVNYALVAVPLSFGLWAGWWSYRVGGDLGDAIGTAVLVPIGTLFLLLMLAHPFRRHLPRTCRTVRGLIGDVVPRNIGTLAVQIGRRPTDDETFDALRRIIVEILGVKPEAVTLEARFVEDLGLG